MANHLDNHVLRYILQDHLNILDMENLEFYNNWQEYS
jgi:hypothetical protein